MLLSTEKIKTYLSAHTSDYGDSSIDSLMDMLYYHYTELNPIDSEKIRVSLRELRRLFENLDEEKFEMVFTLVSDLCIEQERVAFLEGMHVGMRMTAELMEMQK